MPKRDGLTKAGLGTSIVQALSNQVGAAVEVSDNRPGARVAIVHQGAPTAPPPGAV